jgi:hypothetical protein
MPLLPCLATHPPSSPPGRADFLSFFLKRHSAQIRLKGPEFRRFRAVGKSGRSVNFVNLYKPGGPRQDGGQHRQGGVRA